MKLNFGGFFIIFAILTLLFFEFCAVIGFMDLIGRLKW